MKTKSYTLRFFYVELNKEKARLLISKTYKTTSRSKLFEFFSFFMWMSKNLSVLEVCYRIVM